MSKYPPVVMTSRPDVMQLLWFFSTEKHRLTIKKGGGAKTGTDSVCLGVCRSFPFSQQAAACMENKSVTSSSQLMSERCRLNLSSPSHPDWSADSLWLIDDHSST